MSPLLRIAKPAGTQHPEQSMAEPASCVSKFRAQPGVGPNCCASVSDDELEAHIEHCTHLMELSWDWEREGNFADRGEADRWMRLRDEAVRSRSAAQVRRTEEARGLD